MGTVLQLTEMMADGVGVRTSKGFAQPSFHHCVGENYEVPKDGRFTFDYYTRVDVRVADHFETVAKLRRLLETKSFKIEGYQRTAGAEQSVHLDAVSPKGIFSVFVAGDYLEDRVRLAVHTKCLLPPGRTQKMY